ncbi:hypothetical protein [Rosenbergiella nectarea]|uniref:hypothetical protein n=1 Tax=Rosenbergiella nectarea TaxID=988801 RepID=UPI001F4E9629|nr:hypothetical protein [Rosenbergiella nectarea]
MSHSLSINRPSSSDEDEIRVVLRMDRGKTITAVLTPENLALALTGKSDVPVELRFRNTEVILK